MRLKRRPVEETGGMAETPVLSRPDPLSDLGQVFPAHASATQKPSGPQVWPPGELTNVHAWTQSPARQNVPLGHTMPRHGSGAQAPFWQS